MSSHLRHCFGGMPVLITGHTGFKGSWLAIWLRELGAQVIGYSLAAPTTPSNFALSGLAGRIEDIRGDVRDSQMIKEIVAYYRPVTIFHLAAQPIVLDSYAAPQATFETNVNGTINVLEAIRQTDSVRVAVLITTDKVYENREWLWGYRENEPLGGYDPYSASKAMAELAIGAYRQSYFSGRNTAIASARAGNVIGGGDFANFRLLPDCMRALAAGQPVLVRHPQSVRPWQHVLESLSGYLWLAVQLLGQGQAFAEGWNFGPAEWQAITTQMVVEKAIALWGNGQWLASRPGQSSPKETHTLRLNWEKAANRLDWRPVYNWEQAVEATVEWFKGYGSGRDSYTLCVEQIKHYSQQAQKANLPWSL